MKLSAFHFTVSPRNTLYGVRKFAAQLSDSVRLFCRVLAYPTPTYEWFRLDTPEFRPQSTSTRNNLAISSVTERDYGEYVCSAENEVGQRNFTVLLLRPGIIIKHNLESALFTNQCALEINYSVMIIVA